MSSLVSIMSIHQRQELNVIKGNTCNCSHPTWKLTSHAMVTKVLQIASWVLMRSLPCTPHKRWIPVGSMGCVHTHWRMLIYEGWGSRSHVRNVVQKIREDNQKVGKTSRAINQVLAPRPKHNKIQARWASDVLLENMLERVWWWKCFEMESWSWTNFCLMNLSNGRKHAHGGGDRRSHATLKCCWKENVLLWTLSKALKRKTH